MPADRRLFDSSALVMPPAPEIDAVTNNVEPPMRPLFSPEFVRLAFMRFLEKRGDAIAEERIRRFDEIEWVPFRRSAYPVVDAKGFGPVDELYSYINRYDQER